MLATNENRTTSYVLATGQPAVRRLHALHDIYAPAGRRILMQAGLKAGMKVADFGCGVGVVSRMLAEMVGPNGSVTGIDSDALQIEQACQLCANQAFVNTRFVTASAYETRLPRESFDLVYCRFLLLHLTDPAACLREMRAVLKPGGILVVEDGDLASATSEPYSGADEFAHLFTKLGSARGVDFRIGRKLFHAVVDAGFSDVDIEIHQPAIREGENRYFLKWSVEEAAPALVNAGIVTSDELGRALETMQATIDDPRVLILAPRMSLVWARKPAN